MIAIVKAYQCIGCGHVEAPAAQLLTCDSCHGWELHVFDAEDDADTAELPFDIDELEAPLPRSAATKLIEAIAADALASPRYLLETLGEEACDWELDDSPGANGIVDVDDF